MRDWYSLRSTDPSARVERTPQESCLRVTSRALRMDFIALSCPLCHASSTRRDERLSVRRSRYSRFTNDCFSS